VDLKRRLLADFPDTEQRRGLAQSCDALGHVLRVLNKLDEAQQVLEEGARAGEQVARETPRNGRNRLNLRYLYEHLAEVARDRRDPAERERWLRQALDVSRELVNDFPSIPSYQRRLSEVLGYYAEWLSDANRAEKAVPYAQEAVSWAEKQARAFPNEPEPQFILGQRCYQLARTLHAAKRVAEGETFRRRSIEIVDRLWREHPDVAKYGSMLGVSRNGLTFVLMTTGRPEEACEEGLRTVAVFETLVTRFPGDPDHRFRLAEVCLNLSSNVLELGRPDEAEAIARKGIAALEPLADGGNLRNRHYLASLRTNLGTAQVNKGDLDAAIASYREGLRLDPTLTRAKVGLDGAMKLTAEREGRLAPPPREVRR
jgi:tetratricopeptide (TPR) repeat protein